MSSRGPYRRHSAQVKLQRCHDIRSWHPGPARRQRKYSLSPNLIQMWLTQVDRGELSNEEAEASVVADHEAKIAALERKIGQLTMELELVKKNAMPAPRQRQRELLHHHRPEACSIRRGCEVIELSRSTFYYRASEAGDVLSDLQVVRLIESIQDELSGYGYRRVTHELRRRTSSTTRASRAP